MWSTPRSLSTAFEISISTLPDVKVFHEIFLVPALKISNPYTKTPVNSTTSLNHSFEDAREMICRDYPGISAIFTKNTALRIQGRYEAFLDEDFTHSFLIRNPQRVVISSYELSKDCFTEGYSKDEIGFVQLHDFYFFLRRHLSTSPVIIDADDLLANPEEMMELYCKNVGLTYKHGMTKWESECGWGPDFQEQIVFDHPAWHETAVQSTGFKEPTPLPTLPDGLPTEVTRCIKESFELYNELYALRSTVKK